MTRIWRRDLFAGPLLRSTISNLARYYCSYHPYSEIMKPELEKFLNSRLNRGMAFSMHERQMLCIHGLMPCQHRPIEEQVLLSKMNFESRRDALGQYTYLLSLRTQHERVFFRFINENVELAMPIMYTPTVGSAVTLFSTVYRSGMGMFITIFDKGNIMEVLKNWREPGVRAICVTDGGRILGLGDMGANGMGISMGKLFLYTALGGVPPDMLLPITLDVGTDNEQLLNDPHYVGAKVRRVKGPEYEEFVEEFMQAVRTFFGYDTFIHFEDFTTPNAFKFLAKYQSEYTYFNDDIQGTACVGLAGFLAAERVLQKKLQDMIILFVGGGSAAVGISKLLCLELISRGLSDEESVKRIYIAEKDGLVTTDMTGVTPDVAKYAKKQENIADLAEIVDKVKPQILLAATGTRGIISEKVLKLMAKHNERPVIFALSNPTSNAECSAEEAFQHTEGRVLFSSGSPFPPVVYDGKRRITGQANNALVFPGIALGAICFKARHLPSDLYLDIAHTLAQYTSEEHIKDGILYPPMHVVFKLSLAIAETIGCYLIKHDLSYVPFKSEEMPGMLKKFVYQYSYSDALPKTWEYPPEAYTPPEKKS